MFIQVNYLNVTVKIYTDNEKIIVTDKTKSDKLFDMVFKSILNKLNIDINNYTIIRNKIEC